MSHCMPQLYSNIYSYILIPNCIHHNQFCHHSHNTKSQIPMLKEPFFQPTCALTRCKHCSSEDLRLSVHVLSQDVAATSSTASRAVAAPASAWRLTVPWLLYTKHGFWPSLGLFISFTFQSGWQTGLNIESLGSGPTSGHTHVLQSARVKDPHAAGNRRQVRQVLPLTPTPRFSWQNESTCIRTTEEKNFQQCSHSRDWVALILQLPQAEPASATLKEPAH